jgi:hypothetical protein
MCPPIEGHRCNTLSHRGGVIDASSPLPAFGHFHSFNSRRNEAAMRTIGNRCKE